MQATREGDGAVYPDADAKERANSIRGNLLSDVVPVPQAMLEPEVRTGKICSAMRQCSSGARAAALSAMAQAAVHGAYMAPRARRCSRREAS